MSKLRHVAAHVLAAALSVGFMCDPVEARRMAIGIVLPDKYLLPDHPAVAHGLPVLLKLIQRYPDEPAAYHCVLTKADNTPGRVTLQSLYAVVHGSFSAGVFGSAVPERDLQAMYGEPISEAAKYLVKYALARSGNDVAKAISFIKDAERTDAKCASKNAEYWQAQLDLYARDQTLLLDADGIWVVGLMKPGSGTQSFPTAVKILNDTYAISERITKGYRVAYAQLNEIAARTAAPANRPKPAVAKEIISATGKLEKVLEHAKHYCLLKASISECG